MGRHRRSGRDVGSITRDAGGSVGQRGAQRIATASDTSVACPTAVASPAKLPRAGRRSSGVRDALASGGGVFGDLNA